MADNGLSKVWKVILVVVAVIFWCLAILTFVSLGFAKSGAQIAVGAISGVVFILVGILCIVVMVKGKKMRIPVICLLVILVIFFIEAVIQIILWAIARSNCQNTRIFYHEFACSKYRDFYFALVCILLFVSIIGAAAAFTLCLIFRKEDEAENEQYVYLSGTEDTD